MSKLLLPNTERPTIKVVPLKDREESFQIEIEGGSGSGMPIASVHRHLPLEQQAELVAQIVKQILLNPPHNKRKGEE